MLDCQAFSAVVQRQIISWQITTEVETELVASTSFYDKPLTGSDVDLGDSQSIVGNSHGMLVGGAKANIHQISMGRLPWLDWTIKINDAGDAISDAISG